MDFRTIPPPPPHLLFQSQIYIVYISGIQLAKLPISFFKYTYFDYLFIIFIYVCLLISNIFSKKNSEMKHQNVEPTEMF